MVGDSRVFLDSKCNKSSRRYRNCDASVMVLATRTRFASRELRHHSLCRRTKRPQCADYCFTVKYIREEHSPREGKEVVDLRNMEHGDMHCLVSQHNASIPEEEGHECASHRNVRCQSESSSFGLSGCGHKQVDSRSCDTPFPGQDQRVSTGIHEVLDHSAYLRRWKPSHLRYVDHP